MNLLKQMIVTIKLWLGDEICLKCGSYNIIKRGFAGNNMRYACKDCGTTIYVDDWL